MNRRNIIRVITLTLICTMTLSLFAGCSQSGSTTGQSGTPSQSTTPSQPATPTQPSNVYVHTFSNNVCSDCGTPAFTNEKNIYGLTNVIESLLYTMAIRTEKPTPSISPPHLQMHLNPKM